jgi:hypothetical protein
MIQQEAPNRLLPAIIAMAIVVGLPFHNRCILPYQMPQQRRSN